MTEPDDDWWAVSDVAHYLGVSVPTVRSYVSRGQMPLPERRFGNANVWRPATIRAWAPTRRADAKNRQHESG